MRKLLIVACVALLAFSACKDDKESPAPSTPVSPGLLTGKDWRMTANKMELSENGMDTTIDFFADMEPCEKDDLYRFNEDKTVTLKAGATKCQASDPDTEPGGTWELSADGKKITITENGDGDTMDVITLTETTFKVSQTSEVSPGINGKSTITFTRN
jgi:hypothetical protein